MNEVFLDTETTGLSFKDGHKIVEIACIETKDLVPTGNIFHKLINPKRNMPSEAFKIHGFSQSFLSDKETFDEIAEEFLNFVKGKKIIIHNAPFDISFLNGELNSIKKEIVITHPGPINRGVELNSDVIDSGKTVILDQVENGVAVRMAVMYLLASKL